MTRIPDKEIEEMLSNLEKDWDKYYDKYSREKILIEFPLGEIMNPKIGGYVWIWHMKGIIKTGPITEKDKFNAQGLEGKASIPDDLIHGLLVYRELPKFRRQIVRIKEQKYLT